AADGAVAAHRKLLERHEVVLRPLQGSAQQHARTVLHDAPCVLSLPEPEEVALRRHDIRRAKTRVYIGLSPAESRARRERLVLPALQKVLVEPDRIDPGCSSRFAWHERERLAQQRGAVLAMRIGQPEREASRERLDQRMTDTDLVAIQDAAD